MIARSKSASKGSLTFILDGEDLTKQSAKETQSAIDEKLGAGPAVLSRTIFHGQHTMNGLLEATDAKLKEELSIIVPLNIWQDAAVRARKQGKRFSTTLSELDGMIAIRSRDLESIAKKLGSADNTIAARGKAFVEAEEDIKRRLEEKASPHDGEDINIETIQNDVNESTNQIQSLDDALNKNMLELQTDLKPLRSLLDAKTTQLNSDKFELNHIQRLCDRNELALVSATDHLNNLQAKWGVDNANDMTAISFETPSICPTCKQPMSDDESHQHFRDEVENDLSEAMSRIETLDVSVADDQNKLHAQESIISHLEDEIQSITSDIRVQESLWQERQNKLQRDLQVTRAFYSQRSRDFANAVKKVEATNEVNRLKANSASELKYFKDNLTAATDARNSIAKELAEMSEGVKNLEVERENARSEAGIMSSSAENFGARGVQTFILQNTVHALQLASQSYLDELSDGTLQLQLDLDAGDRILRSASVLSSDGSWITRPLSSLSGGQWRRCSLALSLGFSDLVARRGRLCSSLLVLDEPLTHLDSAGRDNVGKLLRKIVQKQATERLDGQVKRIGGLSVSTILIILQDLVAEELSESFDCIDEVVKFKGHSKVVVDEQFL